MDENQMQHGYDWDGENVTGWIMSEKFNGCRVYWDGQTLWSRGGIAIKIPDVWQYQLPETDLDCELYDGIDGVGRGTVAIKYGYFSDTMHLRVFDVPKLPGNYIDRMKNGKCFGLEITKFVDLQECTGLSELFSTLEKVLDRGGEGLILRHPDLIYSKGHTRKILKLKKEGTHENH